MRPTKFGWAFSFATVTIIVTILRRETNVAESGLENDVFACSVGDYCEAVV